MSKKSEKLTAASLFSGAGGLDLGFVRSGFNILWANDNDQDSVETYKINFGNHIELADIESVDISAIPDVDVVIGGFPCQGFSIANTKRKVDDSRNVLYKSFVNIILLKRPRYFLAENVKGILNLGGGTVFKHILSEFSEAGYSCRTTLVNAADYGVPQRRERVFILGIREDLDIFEFNFSPLPTHENKHISIGEALRGLPDPDKENDLKNHVYSDFKLKFNGYIGHRRIDPNAPSPTITARGDNKGGAVIIHHPSNHRRITCREAALIQGFPLNFEFSGSMTSVYRQIGNAVPVQLAEAIARTIKEHSQTALKPSSKLLKGLPKPPSLQTLSQATPPLF